MTPKKLYDTRCGAVGKKTEKKFVSNRIQRERIDKIGLNVL